MWHSKEAFAFDQRLRILHTKCGQLSRNKSEHTRLIRTTNTNSLIITAMCSTSSTPTKCVVLKPSSSAHMLMAIVQRCPPGDNLAVLIIHTAANRSIRLGELRASCCCGIAGSNANHAPYQTQRCAAPNNACSMNVLYTNGWKSYHIVGFQTNRIWIGMFSK